ncbi:histidine kinase [Rhodospirillum rubrum]|uniref:CHASE domain-containing hybrid sensor histidine kinase/response regulator n=1 Tax=Rhodospirillum rubrum TaxID=1085 RepID=UPI00190608E9|nr:PAS domain S-box protein [Rhodospirillum rubrum]MBK1666017.1 histidine kinase [Rhodospirillum rubrum]MBK1678096.1 histidine kinase [Rhodospirillum rubrum]
MTGTTGLGRRIVWWWIVGAALAGIGLSGLAVWWVTQRNAELAETAASLELTRLSDAIAERITLYQYGLRGARGVIGTFGETGITREIFRGYSKTRDIGAEFPGARGFGFIRRVPADRVERFLAEARADGWPDFTIAQFTPHDGERFVIQYIEPAQRNMKAVGLDIASEENRRAAALAAIDTGEVRLTGPITLVQASGDKSQAFLILLPIYRTLSTPETLAERRVQAFGWSYAPLNMPEVLRDLIPDQDLLALTLRDVTNPAEVETVFASDTDCAAAGCFTKTLTRSVFGRIWEISVTVSPAYGLAFQTIAPWVVMSLGAVASLLAAGFAAVIGVNQARRREIAQAQARLSTIVENSGDAIIGEALDGTIVGWNRAAETLFGYKAAEVIGKALAPLLIPADRMAENQSIVLSALSGEAVMAFDTQRIHADGHLFDVSMTACPVHDRRGHVVGVANLIRDIRKRKAAEQSLLEFNAQLEKQVTSRTAELEKARRALQTVLDSVPSMIGYWDRDLRCHIANRAYCSWFNVDPSSLIGKSMRSLLGEALFTANRPFVEAVLRGEPQTFERMIPRPNGQGVRHSLAYYIPDVVDGEVLGFYALVHDVSELVEGRQKLDAALRENEALLRTIDEQLLCSITDRNGNIISINDNFCKLMGYTKDELLGLDHRIMNSGLHDKAFWADVWTMISAGGSWRGEVCNKAKDGALYWLDSVLTPFFGEDGSIDRYVALRIDITDRKKAEAERNRSNTLLRSVLASAREFSIIATDPDGLITIFNSGAEKLLGYSAEEMVGKQTPALIHLAEQVAERGRSLSDEFGVPIEGFRVFVHRSERDGVEAQEWTYVRKDGGHLEVLLVVTAIREDDGRIAGYLGVAQDVSRRKEFERALVLAKQAAEEASVVKGQFLANMSHEIRTPMNAILGMLTLVQRTALTPHQADYVCKAHSAAGSLLGLLNDILDFSKIEAGKLHLEPHPFRLETVLRDLAVVLSGSYGDKGVEVLFDIAPHLPDSFIGDDLRLRQVLLNLAGNALKFTDQGQVIVSVGVLAREADRLTMRMAVSDTGIGIAADQLASIFGAFEQAETSTTRRFGGSGLGLTITRHLVERMGGVLRVESQPGRGSRFWFDITLPVSGDGSESAESGRPLRVLVVEDNPVAGGILAQTVQGLGYDCDLVQESAETKARIIAADKAGRPYDAVLLDWRMPEVDGLTTARILREMGVTLCPQSIIMVTAYGRDVLSLAEQTGDAPFDAVLTKPVTPGQLRDALLRRDLATSEAAATALTPRRLPTPLAGRRLLVVEDNAINRQVAAELLAGAGADIDLAEGGERGVMMVLRGEIAYDAVLMDIQMPDIDGFEATRRIRADARFKALPIVAMTANASRADRAACLAAGMTEHVGKPIDITAIIGVLLSLMTEGEEIATPSPARGTASQGPPDGPLVEDLESITERLGGQLDLLRRLLPSFAERTGELLDEIEDLIGRGQTSSLAMAFHTIKGSAASMGARTLAERAAYWEDRLNQDGASALEALRQNRGGGDEMRTLLTASIDQLSTLLEPEGLGD